MSVLVEGLQRYLQDDVIAKLASVKIGIAGSGGLGSNVAMLLARSGIRQFMIVDADVVESSNLNRQFFFPKDIGVPKVEAIKSKLLELEPEIICNTSQCWLDAHNTADVFSGCDIVVEAVDKAATKAMLVGTLLEAKFFVVSASGLCGWGFSPMTQKNIAGRLITVGDFSNGLEKGLPPMAPRVMQASAMQADAVLSHVLGSCFTAQ